MIVSQSDSVNKLYEKTNGQKPQALSVRGMEAWQFKRTDLHASMYLQLESTTTAFCLLLIEALAGYEEDFALELISQAATDMTEDSTTLTLSTFVSRIAKLMKDYEDLPEITNVKEKGPTVYSPSLPFALFDMLTRFGTYLPPDSPFKDEKPYAVTTSAIAPQPFETYFKNHRGKLLMMLADNESSAREGGQLDYQKGSLLIQAHFLSLTSNIH